MDDIKTYEQIEAYLNGELKGEELQEFEQKMQTDSDFAAQVAQHRDLETMLTSFEVDNWREHAQTLLDEKKKQAPSTIKPIQTAKTTRTLQYLWRAAAIILLVAGLVYFLMPRQSLNPEQLALNYFEQTEATIYSGIERGEDTSDSDQQSLNTAHQQYQQSSYQQAIDALNKIPSNSPLFAESTLLVGLCQLRLQQYNQAIQSFQTVAAHPNTLSQEEANWLLALTYLQNGKLEIGKRQLQEIQAAKGGFSRQAASLLEKL